MAVSDIPAELIVNKRSSWEQFLWSLPGGESYRWDRNIGYMYAVGAVPVEGQGLPPQPPVPNPDAPFTIAEVEYLNTLYIRSINGAGPDKDGNLVLDLSSVIPSGGWTKDSLEASVQASLSKADQSAAASWVDQNYAKIGRAIATGAGLTGGGTLTADRTIALTAAAQASLAKADSAVQPAAITALQPGGRLGARSVNVGGTNLNNITENGSYSGDNLANSPDGSSGFFYIDHFQSNFTDEYAWQRAVAGGLGAANAGYGWQRFREGGSTWSSWDLISDPTGAVDGATRTDIAARMPDGAQDLGPTPDINTIQRSGWYLGGSGNPNVPAQGRFLLDVRSANGGGGYTHQRFIVIVGEDSGSVWERYTNAGTATGQWSAWKKTVDGAGAVDATARILGNGAVPLSSAVAGQVFAKNASGAPIGVAYSQSPTGSSLAQRDGNGQVNVATTPTSTGHATSKSYVDGQVGAKYTKPSTGIPDSDLASKFAKTVNGNAPDANGNVSITVDGGGYIKPTNGIPSTDMTSAVQASLAKADSALQSAPVTSVAGKTGAVTLGPSDVGAAAASHTHTSSQISDSTTFGRSVLTAADAGAARSAINAADAGITITGTGSLTGGGNLTANRALDLTAAAKASLAKADTALQSAPVTSVAGKTGAVTLGPTDVGAAAASHTHTASQITDGTSTFAAIGRAIATGTGLQGGGTLAADRTISLTAAAQASLAKADTALQSAPVTSVSGKTGAVSLSKSDVSLGNVDNTSDSAKPVSTAQQTALNGKADAINNVLRAGAGALGSVDPSSLPGVGGVVAIGQGAMANTKSVKLSIAIGRNAMGNTSTSRDNIAIGDESLRNVNSGSPDYTQSDLSGTRNVGIGSNSAYFLTGGYLNVAIGRNTGSCQVGGQGATSIGGNALGGFAPIGFSGAIENWAPWGSGSDRVYTTAIGSNALQSSTSAANTAVGGDALQKNKASSYNTAMGVQALSVLDSGTGYGGGTYTTLNLSGTYNWSGTSLTITASGHGMSVGDTAFLQLTSGPGQTFQGDQAPAVVSSVSGTSFTVTTPTSVSGTGNATVVARETAAQASRNENNLGLGHRAGASMLTGSFNAAVGSRAAESATTATQSSAFGAYAFINATSLANSTGVGFYAGASMTGSADRVTAVGASALRNRVDGQPMTDAFVNVTGLGYDSRVSGSNQVQLGNTTQTVYAQSAIQTRSDARDKAEVRDTVLGLDFISSLRPVDFKWDRREDYTEYDEDGNGVGLAEKDGSRKGERYHHGFIAQEVQEVIEKSGVDFGGFQDHKVNGGSDVLSIGYEELIAPMVSALQEMRTMVDSLREEIAELKAVK